MFFNRKLTLAEDYQRMTKPLVNKAREKFSKQFPNLVIHYIRFSEYSQCGNTAMIEVYFNNEIRVIDITQEDMKGK